MYFIQYCKSYSLVRLKASSAMSMHPFPVDFSRAWKFKCDFDTSKQVRSILVFAWNCRSNTVYIEHFDHISLKKIWKRKYLYLNIQCYKAIFEYLIFQLKLCNRVFPTLFDIIILFFFDTSDVFFSKKKLHFKSCTFKAHC